MNKISVSSADLDIISTRLIISAIININSQSHVGKDEDNTEFASKNSILTTYLSVGDPNVYPYIPSSSIKGIMRSEIEKLAKLIPNKKDISIVESIFGGKNLATHVIISDALPTDETKKNFQAILKPGIAINRKTLTTKEKSLFFIETLQPRVEFKFEMIINNITESSKPLEFRLLKNLFNLIKRGLLSIGGKRSVGMGKFTFQNAKIKELTSKEEFLFPEKVQSQDLFTYFKI